MDEPSGASGLHDDPDCVLDSTSIEPALDSLPSWPFGPVRVVEVTRIGAEHGLSGQVHRVVARKGDASSVTFIVKQESAAGTQRALTFHSSMGDQLRGEIPACYGGIIDAAMGVGVLFLEDVAPATQGDVLIDPGDEAADVAIRTIARVHAASWRAQATDLPATLPRWHAEVWAAGRWSDRLAGARARFPEILTDAVVRRLDRLPGELAGAIAALQTGPASWIHSDAHLDNILWRPDGSAVLLDWSGAVIGPPAVDAARFLIEGTPGVPADEARSAALIETYRRELEHQGVPAAAGDLVPIAIGQAMLALAQSVVGWAGRPDRPLPGPRLAALRENAVRNLAAWLLR